jgi:hypothetical protein
LVVYESPACGVGLKMCGERSVDMQVGCHRDAEIRRVGGSIGVRRFAEARFNWPFLGRCSDELARLGGCP